MTSSIAVFGSFTIDDLVFPEGSTRWAVPGGGAVYAALGASLWTEGVSIVAPLGADYPIESLGNRVDLTRCRPIQRTLRNWGLYEEDGQRHFISRNAARDWSAFCPTAEDAASGIQTAVHIAPVPYSIATALVRRLRQAGTAFISLDLDDHDLLGRSGREGLVELINQVDIFLPSQQDMLALFPDTNPLESLRKLRNLAPKPRLVAITCGANGTVAHALEMSRYVHIPAVSVGLVDGTGAGDSFCGGVLAGITQTNDHMDALLYGAVSASFCVENFGFTSLSNATSEEAQYRLALLRPQLTFH